MFTAGLRFPCFFVHAFSFFARFIPLTSLKRHAERSIFTSDVKCVIQPKRARCFATRYMMGY